jgi:O-antigen ligase
MLPTRNFLIAPALRTAFLNRRPLPAGAAPPPALSPDPEFTGRADVLRTLAFYMGLALVFVKFAMLADIQTYLMGFKAYLLYVFGIPAAVGVVLAGGLRRGMAGRPAYYWVGFGLWMCVCVPFSAWRGSSFGIARGFFQHDLIIMFMIAGLVVTWRECRLLANTIGGAALVNILCSRIFAGRGVERLDLEFGMLANSNDFAAHLLLTMPFLLLFVYNSKSLVLRAAAFLALGYGAVVIVRTGSRGALVALIADSLFVFFWGSIRQRIVMVCIASMAVITVMAVVPSNVLRRITSFSAAEEGVSEEALQSSAARRYLLTKSIEYTIEFPVFGLGPGQFVNYEGQHNVVIGSHGMYQPPHNSYLQAFTEMGVPGGILNLAAYISSFLMVNRTYRKARLRPDCRDIQNTAFCIMLGMLGFCAAIAFVNFTYFFYGPALGGMAISVWRAANYEFDHRELRTA